MTGSMNTILLISVLLGLVQAGLGAQPETIDIQTLDCMSELDDAYYELNGPDVVVSSMFAIRQMGTGSPGEPISEIIKERSISLDKLIADKDAFKAACNAYKVSTEAAKDEVSCMDVSGMKSRIDQLMASNNFQGLYTLQVYADKMALCNIVESN